MTFLVSEFAMKDLDPLNYFLGNVVTRHTGGMFLNQSTYASCIIARIDMTSWKILLLLRLILTRSSVHPQTHHMRIPLCIGVLSAPYNSSPSLVLTFHMMFNKSIFTCMPSALSTC